MADPEFTTYKVVAECRGCGEEFETLAFFDTPGKRYGLCETCAWVDKKRQEARQVRPDPLAKKRKVTELTIPRRTEEPD